MVAITTGDEARFVHDPRAGSELWQRMNVQRIPTAPPRKALGVRTASQQRDDIAHLRALAEAPKFVPAANGRGASIGGSNGSDATERLAAWLLEQTDLSGQAGES